MTAARPPDPGAGQPLAPAVALIGEGRFEEARTLLLNLVAAAGNRAHPHALYLIGICADTLADPAEALAYFERARAAAPDDPQVVGGLANFLGNTGRIDGAVAILRDYLATHPFTPGLANSLAKMLAELNRLDEALAVAESARIALGELPDLALVHGAILERLGRPDEALSLYRRTRQVLREAALQFNLGRTSESLDLLRRAAEQRPSDSSPWIQYAFYLNYSDTAPAAEQLRAHRQCGLALRAQLGPPFTSWNVARDPDRPLRVGIVSPDMRRHAVVSFLAPLLENYEKSQWHLTAYSTTRKNDDVTARLRSLVDDWRDIPKPNPRYLARRIREDRIDVLIELSGLTENSAIHAVHLRPAPVQVTYLGYPNTTGLDTVDLRIIDSITDPSGAERLAVERLARIDPCFLCYKPIVDSPPLAPPPSAAGKPIAFGSFNLPIKISPTAVRLWSRALKEVPNSTLVLKHAALTDEWMRTNLARRLAEAGIEASRVTVLPPMPSYSDHLAAYTHVDIALDTYPYHGTTTTCEALWMGVPVITLTGDRHASRVGTSLLSAVGLPDLAAGDESGFVRLASTLANSPSRLAAWRTPGPTSLREIMANSALCDARAFTSRFQATIRQAWQSWCAAPR